MTDKKGAFQNQKYVFLQALILTLIVFNIGIYIGYKLETSRIDKINQLYLESEMNLLDQRIQREAFDLVNLDCNNSIKANIDFADKIFEQAQEIQKLEDANRLTSEVFFQHRRFDLLRTLFWMNSIQIKKKCNAEYHNVVYFYNFGSATIEQKAKQGVFSNLLLQIKETHGNKIMLIPIAADRSLPSIDLLLNHYKIDKLPVILIDEKVKITEIETAKDIEKYLN